LGIWSEGRRPSRMDCPQETGDRDWGPRLGTVSPGPLVRSAGRLGGDSHFWSARDRVGTVTSGSFEAQKDPSPCFSCRNLVAEVWEWRLIVGTGEGMTNSSVAVRSSVRATVSRSSYRVLDGALPFSAWRSSASARLAESSQGYIFGSGVLSCTASVARPFRAAQRGAVRSTRGKGTSAP
jgi:hypothetical protein